jgi:hypothetical protein
MDYKASQVVDMCERTSYSQVGLPENHLRKAGVADAIATKQRRRNSPISYISHTFDYVSKSFLKTFSTCEFGCKL